MTVRQTVTSSGTLTLTIDAPEKRNALSMEVLSGLAAGLERLSTDDTLRIGVITGGGDFFCAGGDTSRMGVARPSPWGRRDYLDQGVGHLARLFVALDKPVIAGVNGPAIGAGVDLALWCDFRIAVSDAYLRAGFIDLGVTPGFGSAWHLTRMVGRSTALDILLTGRRVPAEEALALGVFRAVLPDRASLAAQVQGLADLLAAKSSPAVRATKRLVQRAESLSELDSLELAWAQFGLLQETPEHEFAVEALRQRRERRATEGDPAAADEAPGEDR